jgi:hypothetical protein
MSTLSSLVENIDKIVQDTDEYPEIVLANLVNDAVNTIAAGVRLLDGRISPPLPDLYKITTVYTTVHAYLDLPGTHQRNVFLVADSSGNRIAPPKGGDYYSFMLFLNSLIKKDLSETGSVLKVCVRGKRLYYQGIPSVQESLTIHHYRKPVRMTGGGNVVDGIPEHLTKRLVVNYVISDIMGSQIEDGEGSAKAGAAYHQAEFHKALIDLADFIGEPDAEPMYMAGDDNF